MVRAELFRSRRGAAEALDKRQIFERRDIHPERTTAGISSPNRWILPNRVELFQS